MSSSAVAAAPSRAAAPRNTARRNQRGPSMPVNRAGCRPPVPSDAVTWARSSGPNGPSASSTSPPDWLMDDLICARTSAHRPPLRGAA